MIEWIRRKKLRKISKTHFGSDDFMIAGFRLNAVHIIPEYIDKNQELDFYLDTGYDIYLLRLINGIKKSITVCPAKRLHPIYLICNILYTNQNIFEVLNYILEQLNMLGSPKIANPKQQITIKF